MSPHEHEHEHEHKSTSFDYRLDLILKSIFFWISFQVAARAKSLLFFWFLSLLIFTNCLVMLGEIL